MSSLDITNNDTIINEFNKIITDNTLFRFNRELENCHEEEKKVIITKIIKKMGNSGNNNEYDTKEINKNKLNNFLDKITHNKYKQTWTRLNLDQKTTKIEEFINNIDNTEIDKKEKEKLVLKLKDMLNTNKLLSSKEVKYDKIECKILSIKNFDEIKEEL
jgi:hypothetical protein